MVNSRSFLLAGFMLMFAVAINLFLERDHADQEVTGSLNRNDPDLYMRNATITQFTKTGIRQHRINATRFTHFPLTDITTLKQPDMTLYATEPDENPWDIIAQNGRLLPQVAFREEIVELWDDVLAIQTDPDGEFINIRTNSLTIFPATDYAETDQKVIIDDNTGRTTAAGMKAYFEQGKFIFFSRGDERVKTILLPEFEKSTD
jgi:lipopolysaccharide export system protein LptC